MTRNYWVVRLGQGNAYADIAHRKGFIMVGWMHNHDLSKFLQLDQEEFVKKVIEILKKEHPEGSEKWYGGTARQLFKFSVLAKIGDVVISPADSEGRKYFGIIKSDYYYQPNDKENDQPHRRDVDWIGEFHKDVFSEAFRNSSGAIMTMFNVSKYAEEIEKLIRDIKINDTEGTIEDFEDFGMESHLEDFIIENWEKMALLKNYEIYKEDEEMVGQQYVTPIGRIDILAKSKDGKEWLVIEIKKGKSSDDVVGQILRYVGWVKKNEAAPDEKVRAIIIAGEKDEKLKYALETLENVEFMTYEVEFRLKKD